MISSDNGADSRGFSSSLLDVVDVDVVACWRVQATLPLLVETTQRTLRYSTAKIQN